MLLFLAACSEYVVNGKKNDPVPGDDTGRTVDTDTDTLVDSDPGTDSGTVTVPTSPCEDLDFSTLQWWGSMPFTSEADPVDGSGVAFYDAGFTLTDWSTVSVPDSGHNPAGNDRAYRAVLTLPSAGERLFVDLQSDDGLWLWVNGTEIGHWGGGWQEEGCVNDEALCLETETVAPVEVTDALVAGENVLAARVSNAVEGSYFQLHAYCVE